MKKEILHKMSIEKRELLDMIAQTEMKHLCSKKIMIIDDSEESIFVISSQLKKTGEYSVLSFTSEFDALKEISKQAPELIILDIMLETIDGIKFALTLKGLEYYAGPIIFISSNKSFEKELLKTFGDKCIFMNKPINLTKLSETVFRILEH